MENGKRCVVKLGPPFIGGDPALCTLHRLPPPLLLSTLPHLCSKTILLNDATQAIHKVKCQGRHQGAHSPLRGRRQPPPPPLRSLSLWLHRTSRFSCQQNPPVPPPPPPRRRRCMRLYVAHCRSAVGLAMCALGIVLGRGRMGAYGPTGGGRPRLGSGQRPHIAQCPGACPPESARRSARRQRPSVLSTPRHDHAAPLARFGEGGLGNLP